MNVSPSRVPNVHVIPNGCLAVLMELLRFGVSSHSPDVTMYFTTVNTLPTGCFVFFIVSCYTILFRETSRLRKKIMTEQIPQEEVRRFSAENKMLKTTACVLGAILLCYQPLILFMSVIMILRPWVLTLVALNSLLNPFVYCWRQKEMRRFIFRNPFSLHAVGPG